MRAGLMTKNSTWYLLKLSNMSTITREWIALQHAHLCPFADILTSCNARALHESRHMDIPPGMKETMEVQCNASQVWGAVWGGVGWGRCSVAITVCCCCVR